MNRTPIPDGAVVVIVGGGLSGVLLASNLAAARSDLVVHIIERGARLGPGLAYGACASNHLLNVPVNRLDLGFAPSFETWLMHQPAGHVDIADALAESGGRLEDAFVQRRLFGRYVEDLAGGLISAGRLHWIRGEAVAFLDQPARGLMLSDGREVMANVVVLALGNLPPKTPARPGSGLEDMESYVPDPWAHDALSGIGVDDSVLLLGTGLTMIDIVLALGERGHRGDLVALSRRGLLPRAHAFGGQWPPFMNSLLPLPPSKLLRAVRRETARAESRGVPWQRVIDSVRPFVAKIWQGWSAREKQSFLRHLRTRWDVVRHRMAPRIARQIERLLARERLRIMSGRLAGCRRTGNGIVIDVQRSDSTETLRVGHVVNCTRPRSDYHSVGIPLILNARDKRIVLPDTLGLGIETDNCAVKGPEGGASTWLFAIGPLTRPAWWEITAAPEIAAQALDLATLLTTSQPAQPLADRFLDLGAGI